LVGVLAALRRRRPLGPPAPAALTGQHAADLVADLLRVSVEVVQNARTHALVLAHHPEQDVLGTDVVVAQAQRLPQGELEDLLGAMRERNLDGGDFFARADDLDDPGADALDGDIERLQHAGGQPFFLAEQAEQDVLGTDVVVLQRAGLLLGEDDHLDGAFCEPLEQLVFSW
jgi:hypothetical protein